MHLSFKHGTSGSYTPGPLVSGQGDRKSRPGQYADTGLKLSEFTIIEVLLHRGSLPINAIGEKVLLTSGSMTAAINHLEF